MSSSPLNAPENPGGKLNEIPGMGYRNPRTAISMPEPFRMHRTVTATSKRVNLCSMLIFSLKAVPVDV